MTMTVKGFEKNNGVACVVVSIPLDELFNIPALSPILEQLTAPDASSPILQDTSVIPADVIKTRKPRVKKTAIPAGVIPATTPTPVMPTYPGRKKSAQVAPAKPAKAEKAAKAAPAEKPDTITKSANTAKPATAEKSNNTNEAKMAKHCPHCKPEQFGTYKQWLSAGYKVKPGEHGVRLMGISTVVEDGKQVNKPFFFTKFCSCQVEAVVAKQVG